MTEHEKKFFEAGQKLSVVGASFFVSYLYFLLIDSTHSNWRLANTNSTTTVKSNKKYWCIWLEAIIYKDPSALGQNKIQLSGRDIIKMAKTLLPLLKEIC